MQRVLICTMATRVPVQAQNVSRRAMGVLAYRTRQKPKGQGCMRKGGGASVDRACDPAALSSPTFFPVAKITGSNRPKASCQPPPLLDR